MSDTIVGVDVGGTFTDLFFIDGATVQGLFYCREKCACSLHIVQCGKTFIAIQHNALLIAKLIFY